MYLNQFELVLILMMISEQSSFAQGVLIAEQLWGNITDVNVIFHFFLFDTFADVSKVLSPLCRYDVLSVGIIKLFTRRAATKHIVKKV